MTFYFDIYGNVTNNVDPNRSTELEPPTCPTGQQANWSGSGWMCVAWTQPPAPVPPAWPLGSKITPLAYVGRIGQAAMIGIYAAAQTNPNIQVFIAETWGAQYIDLADPDVTTDLNDLVSASLLTEAQVTAILTAPVQQIELPE